METDAYITRVLQDLHVTEQQYNSFIQITNRFKPSPGIYYQSQYSRDGSIIMVGTISQHPIEPINGRRPDQDLGIEQFTELTFPIWKTVCRGDAHAISNLQWMLAKRITQFRTLDLIRNVIMADRIVQVNGDGFYRMAFNPPNLGFYALLQSRTGRDMSDISKQYHASLGHKTVTRIIVYYVTSIEAYFMAMRFTYDRKDIDDMRQHPERRPRNWPANWRSV